MVRKWANGTEPAGSQFHEAQREKWGGEGESGYLNLPTNQLVASFHYSYN